MYVCTKRVHAMFLSGRPAKATSLRHCTKSLNHPNKVHEFRIFVIGKSGIGFPFFEMWEIPHLIPINPNNSLEKFNFINIQLSTN